ncbi:MAG: hypothetical protein IKD14_03610 [Clostridia bacterium]|nr:hypothetical protein [Clostridia bacterium]
MRVLIKNNDADIMFMMGEIFTSIAQSLEKITFAFNSDLIKNVLLRGLPMKTKKVLEGK